MLRTIVSMGFFQLIGIVANAARSKLFAVLLGPAGFGVIATIDQLVMSAVQIGNLSLPFTALKFLSRDHSLGEAHFRKSYAAFLKAIALLAVIATIVMLVAVPVSLAKMDSQLAAYRGVVTIAFLGIPGTMVMIYLVNVLAARREGVRSVVLTVISGLTILVSGGIGCFVGGINGIYYGTVPAISILTIGTIIYFRRKLNLPVRHPGNGIWTELRNNSVMLETTAGVYIAMASSAAQLFVARYVSISQVGAEAAGLLQASLSIALSIGAVLGPANTLYLSPYLNRALPAREKMEAAERFLPRMIFLFFLGALPVLLFPSAVLHVLFSNRFIAAAAILPWFVVWQCLFHTSNIYQQLLLGLDDARGFSVVTAAGNCVSVGCSIWLVGRLGLVGVAAGFVSGGLVTAISTAIRLRSKHGLSIPRSAPRLVIFALVSFWAVAWLGRMTSEGSLFGVASRGAIAAVFLGVLWFVLPGKLRSELAGTVKGQFMRISGRFALGKS